MLLISPEMVEGYGRERLLSAPAYRTTPLEDGGIMVVGKPNPVGNSELHPIDTHLGIESPELNEDLY